ncbi:MAG: hypothetical protein ABWZ25_10880 [Chitinophagaceae bacterium]
MDKIKFSLFDIFVYTIPGIVIMFGIYLLPVELKPGMESFIKSFGKLMAVQNLNTITLAILVAYLIGFTLHYFGYRYFYFITSRFWKKRFADKLKNKPHSEAKYVLVRHQSKDNFAYIDQWNTYRGMSFNLSLSFLIVGLQLSLMLILQGVFRMDWILLIAVLFLMSFITFKRSVIFHFWSLSTLEETFAMLNQSQEQPQEEPQKVLETDDQI